MTPPAASNFTEFLKWGVETMSGLIRLTFFSGLAAGQATKHASKQSAG